jgi:hypothetical protein
MFSVENHGTIVLVRPHSDDVKSWLEEHTDEEAQWFGSALVVEPRYVAPIVEALVEEGYALQ